MTVVAADSIFPITLFPVEAPPANRLCRASKQRILRRRKHLNRCNDTLQALNWLGHATCAERGTLVSNLHAEIRQRVVTLVSERKLPDDPISPEEAARTLLRAKSGYEMADVNVASFEDGLVSLPESVLDAPNAADLGGDDTQVLIKGLCQSQLRSEEELKKLDSTLGVITPYMDRTFVRSHKKYVKFLRDLDRRGLLLWTKTPKERAAIFFVKKKNGSLRLIIDARRANRRFKDPPGVELCTAEGLGRIEIDLEDTEVGEMATDREVGKLEEDRQAVEVTMGQADVKDCFYRMKIDKELAEYFSLPPVSNKEWYGLDSLGGRDPEEAWFPCIGALPMGFSWSLFLAQKINEYRVSQSEKLKGTTAVCDRGGPMLLGPGRPPSHYVYVDNLGVMGVVEADVANALEGACNSLKSSGLDTHEEILCKEKMDSLGVELDAARQRTRLTDKRYWRLEGALEWTLRQSRLSGQLVEQLVGHCTFAGLICRYSLSCFSATYKFIHRHYHQRVPLWDSVRKELTAFKGLLPLLVSDWGLQWRREVLCSDASEEGYGGCVSYWPRGTVAHHGRHPERSRYRLGAGEARVHAAQSYKEMEEKSNLEETEGLLKEKSFETNADFEEIPEDLLDGRHWRIVRSGRWKYEEAIMMLEAQAAVGLLHRAARTSVGSNHRRLMLVDNLGMCLAFDRCRAKNTRLLGLIQRWSAICLSRNLRVTMRWIPSEVNVADAPSRGFTSIATGSKEWRKRVLLADGAEASEDSHGRGTWRDGEADEEPEEVPDQGGRRCDHKELEKEKVDRGPGGDADNEVSAGEDFERKESSHQLGGGQRGKRLGVGRRGEFYRERGGGNRRVEEEKGKGLAPYQAEVEDGVAYIRRAELPGGLQCDREGLEGLQAEGGGAFRVVREARAPDDNRCRGGRGHSEVHECEVRERVSLPRGRETASGIRVPVRRFRTEREPEVTKGPPSSERLEEEGTTPFKATSPLDGGGRHRLQTIKEEAVQDGCLGDSVVWRLPSAKGDNGTSTRRPDSASDRCDKSLVLVNLSRRKARSDKDWRKRRLSGLGRRVPAVVQSGTGGVESRGSERAFMGLQLRRNCRRDKEGERGAADIRGAVSVAPCRPVLGKTDKAEDLRANPKERRWKTMRSVTRYEKAARLTHQVQSLTSHQLHLCEACVGQVEEFVLGRADCP